MISKDHPRTVSKLLGSIDGGSLSDTERLNLEIVLKMKDLPLDERLSYVREGAIVRRFGFHNLIERTGIAPYEGYTPNSIADRVDVAEETFAQGDRVCLIFRVVGTQTGSIFGTEPNAQQIDILEVGIWRFEDGKIAEAWFLGDELALLDQMRATAAPVSSKAADS